MSIGFLGGGKMAEAIIAGLRKDDPNEAIMVYDIDRKRLTELAQRVGEDMDVDLFYVDALVRTGAGKLRFVVSELPK